MAGTGGEAGPCDGGVPVPAPQRAYLPLWPATRKNSVSRNGSGGLRCSTPGPVLVQPPCGLTQVTAAGRLCAPSPAPGPQQTLRHVRGVKGPRRCPPPEPREPFTSGCHHASGKGRSEDQGLLPAHSPAWDGDMGPASPASLCPSSKNLLAGHILAAHSPCPGQV